MDQNNIKYIYALKIIRYRNIMFNSFNMLLNTFVLLLNQRLSDQIPLLTMNG